MSCLDVIDCPQEKLIFSEYLLDILRKKCPYLSVFSSNAEKYGENAD